MAYSFILLLGVSTHRASAEFLFHMSSLLFPGNFSFTLSSIFLSMIAVTYPVGVLQIAVAAPLCPRAGEGMGGAACVAVLHHVLFLAAGIPLLIVLG